MSNPLQEARRKTTFEEIDYVFLVTALQKWAAPRNVISRLVHSGELIRVKKGIYLFGPNYARRPFSPEVLANKIYGPSYISAEYALSFWGLIPEGVQEITSMTTGKSKRFSTPVGRFSYHHLDTEKFSVGMTYVKFSDGYEEYGALMATPEKALVDLLMIRKEQSRSVSELTRVLYEDLRIDPHEFYKLRVTLFQEISKVYCNHIIQMIIQILIEAKSHA